MLPILQQLKQVFRTHCRDDEGLLDALPLFSTLSKKEKKQLGLRLYRRSFAANEVIYCENSAAAAVYFIIQGSVGLFKAKGEGIQDRVHYVSPGKCFGSTALFGQSPSFTSAQALEATSVFILFRNDFLSLMEEQPGTALKILIAVGQELYADWAESRTEFLSLTHRLTNANIVV